MQLEIEQKSGVLDPSSNRCFIADGDQRIEIPGVTSIEYVIAFRSVPTAKIQCMFGEFMWRGDILFKLMPA